MNSDPFSGPEGNFISDLLIASWLLLFGDTCKLLLVTIVLVIY
jgi:hypothetical protein